MTVIARRGTWKLVLIGLMAAIAVNYGWIPKTLDRGAPHAYAVTPGAPAGPGGWARPVAGHTTSPFGMRTRNGNTAPHKGIDYAAETGTPVHAAAAGTVTRAQYGWNGRYGNLVVIDHGAGVETRYAHLDHIDAATGAPVAAGTVIGRAGATGDVSGPHLHFEIRRGGEAIDPATEGLG